MPELPKHPPTKSASMHASHRGCDAVLCCVGSTHREKQEMPAGLQGTPQAAKSRMRWVASMGMTLERYLSAVVRHEDGGWEQCCMIDTAMAVTTVLDDAANKNSAKGQDLVSP